MNLRSVLAACLFACPSLVLAGPSSSATDEITVTATRTARTVDDTLAAVSVITRQDIERLQASLFVTPHYQP